MFKLKAFILFFVYIYPIFLTSWSLINLKGRLHVSKNIVSMYGIMEQVWHANGLMAQWHSPPYVRFSSRGQIPLSIRKKEKEKEKSVALIRLEVGPWCNGKCLPPKLMSHMFKSRNQHLPQKKNAGKPAYQSPLTNPTKWVFCALGTTLLVINVIQHTSAIFFYLMEFRNCPWYYSPCSNLHQKALIAPPQR